MSADLDAIHKRLTLSSLESRSFDGAGPDIAPPLPPPPPIVALPQAVNEPVAPPMPSGIAALADVAPERLDWLWPGYLAFGKLTMLCGDPGIGKSFVTMKIAAAVTRGHRLPGDSRLPTQPRDVLVVNFEDDVADTIRPRADQCGADVSRTLISKASIRDVATLEEVVASRPELALIVIDPVVSLMRGRDQNSNGDVREALDPLVALARRYHIAILTVTHLKKGEVTSALHKMAGSVAGFGGLPRVVLAVDELDAERKALVPVKSNNAAHAPALAFSIGDDGLTWLGETDEVDARSVFTSARKAPGQMERAKAFWVQALAAGPRLVRDVEEEARAAGIATRTLQRAREALGVERIPPREARGAWSVRLPPAFAAGGFGTDSR